MPAKSFQTQTAFTVSDISTLSKFPTTNKHYSNTTRSADLFWMSSSSGPCVVDFVDPRCAAKNLLCADESLIAHIRGSRSTTPLDMAKPWKSLWQGFKIVQKWTFWKGLTGNERYEKHANEEHCVVICRSRPTFSLTSPSVLMFDADHVCCVVCVFPSFLNVLNEPPLCQETGVEHDRHLRTKYGSRSNKGSPYRKREKP